MFCGWFVDKKLSVLFGEDSKLSISFGRKHKIKNSKPLNIQYSDI